MADVLESLQPSPSSSADSLARLLEAELQQADSEELVVEQPVDSRSHAAQELAPELLSGGNSPEEGSTKKHKFAEAPEVSGKRARADLATAPCPPHPGLMHGMCIRCGCLVDEGPDHTTGLALRYIHDKLQISKSEAERIRQQDLRRKLGNRKLLLVLDLDHTLLNSSRAAEISSELREQLQSQLESQAHPELVHLPHMAMWTKLRPGVRSFLATCAPLFEMCIYTHGDREYAAQMAKLLDPSGSLFADRIISQGDSTQRHVKDLDIVLGDDTAVLIVDDTAGVWPNHSRNLIQVERYIYFPADAARWEATQPALLERDSDEDPSSNALHAVAGVLTRVHQQLFAQADQALADVDVRRHLAGVQRGVLAGTRVVFSRVFPVDMPDPQEHPLWQLALQLGAEVSRGTDACTTHVVAGGDRTDKVLWARRHNKHAVAPAWLHASALSWQRADENCYQVSDERQRARREAEPSRSLEEDAEIARKAAGGGSPFVLSNGST